MELACKWTRMAPTPIPVWEKPQSGILDLLPVTDGQYFITRRQRKFIESSNVSRLVSYLHCGQRESANENVSHVATKHYKSIWTACNSCQVQVGYIHSYSTMSTPFDIKPQPASDNIVVPPEVRTTLSFSLHSEWCLHASVQRKRKVIPLAFIPALSPEMSMERSLMMNSIPRFSSQRSLASEWDMAIKSTDSTRSSAFTV